MISVMSFSFSIVFCSLFFMFLRVTLSCLASSGPISTAYWSSLRSASESAFEKGLLMSSISVGIPFCLKVDAIVLACVSMSLFSGIMITCFLVGLSLGVLVLVMARVMRSIPSATPTAGVGSPPKSSMSLS